MKAVKFWLMTIWLAGVLAGCFAANEHGVAFSRYVAVYFWPITITYTEVGRYFDEAFREPPSPPSLHRQRDGDG